MKLLIPEIFAMVDKAKTKEEKIEVLRKHDSQPLRAMLYLNYGPVKLQLPEGEPPFKKDKQAAIGLSESNLYKEARRLYIWIEDNNLHKIKKEKLFIDLLEGIHWTEAEMLCAAKDKELQKKYKSLKEPLVREAFPGLLPEKQEETQLKK